MWERWGSLGVHLVLILAVGIGTGDWEAAAAMSILSVCCLVLIWFPEQINAATMGMGGIRGPRINKKTPGCLIAAFGWVGTFALMILVIKVLIHGKK